MLVLPSVRILPAMPDVPVARVGRLLVQDVQPSLRVVVDAGKRGPDPVRRRGRPPLPAVRRRRVDRDRAPVVARHQRERARWGARDLGGGGHSHDRGVEDAGERRIGDEHRGRGCVREELPVVPGRVRVLRLDDVGEEARRGRRRLERRRGRLHDSDLDFRRAWHPPRHLHLHRRHAGVRPAHADDAGHVGGCRGERERSPSPAPGLRRLALGVAGEVHDAISEPRPIAPKRRVCVLVRRRRGTRQKDLVPLGRQSHGGLDAPIHPDRAGALGRSLPRDEERPIGSRSHRHERGGRDRDLDVGLVRGRGANAVVHGDGAERDPCAVRNLRQHEFAGGRAAARPERLRPRTVSHPHLHDDAVRSRARGKEPLRGDLRPTERRGRERDGELGRRRRRGRPLDVEPAAAAYEHRRRQRDGRPDRRTSHRSPCRRARTAGFPAEVDRAR